MSKSSLKRVLIIMTSHNKHGKTGCPYESLAIPYWKFKDAGYDIDIVSVHGGSAPVIPASPDLLVRSKAVKRFVSDPEGPQKIQNTRSVASLNTTERTNTANYTMIFIPGGHGAMWDLPGSKALAQIIEKAWAHNTIIGALCHGVAGLLLATRPDELPLVQGLPLTACTNAEENSMSLEEPVPFQLETQLRLLGALFESTTNFKAHVVQAGTIITGQNMTSAEKLAECMITTAASQPAKAKHRE